ncbi:MAG TPA: SUF system NifU family Fe-S cluster assembly protein [Candidatus Bathyarchaeia archaeon]|nr:SUF system NifU family Fe-S cluster assembly protein [Candidatus Bathyarchaeia archaeon]
MSSDIYKDIILDYYRHPRNSGDLQDPDVRAKDSNPLCGDIIEMQLKIKDGKINDLRFKGRGCAISQASASMLTELAKGKTMEEAKALGKTDILNMLGIDPGPTRIKCALLGLKVLKLAIYAYLGQAVTEEVKQLV